MDEEKQSGEDPAPGRTEENARVRASRPGYLSPFSYPFYARLWTSLLFCNLSYWMVITIAAWLMTSRGTVQQAALVQTAAAVPVVLLSFLGGSLSDRFPGSHVMMGSQLFLVSGAFGLALLTLNGAATPTLIFLMTFMAGAGHALRQPSMHAAAQDVLPRRELLGAIALNSTNFSVARTIGPAIAGVLIAIVGSFHSLLVCVALSSLAILLLAGWPRTPKPAVDDALPGHGSRFAVIPILRRMPVLRSFLFRNVLLGVAGSALLALLPVVVRADLGGGSDVYGQLLGISGAGGIIGAALSVTIRRHVPVNLLMSICLSGFGLATIGFAVFRDLPVLMLLAALSGALWLLVASSSNLALQLSAPHHLRSRVLSFHFITLVGGSSLGSWIFGWIAEAYGTSFSLIVAGAILQIGWILFFTHPVWHEQEPPMPPPPAAEAL